MITITRYTFLPKLKSIWNELYKGNSTLSVFQSYEFIYNYWKNSWVYFLTHGEIPIFYLILEDGIPKMIAPLCKKRDGSFEIMGYKNGFEYCDFIYADNTNVEKYVSKLLNQLNRKIVFVRIKEDSMLYKSFVGKNNMRDLGESVCINVSLPDNYNDYYKRLSSSVRQNLRTAFNRLKRDGHTTSLKVIKSDGNCVSWTYEEMGTLPSTGIVYHERSQSDSSIDTDFSQMLALYYQRHKERYGERTSKLKMWYMKNINFMTESLRHMHSSMSVMLFIDNELAAFMSGLKSPGESDYIIPRLSINGKYSFYSPGMLLVNETVRYLIEKTSNRNLDLSLGTENYKTQMGGVIF